MSRLTWGAPTERFFETGVDRGVLYVGVAAGVPWNGLVSVSEAPTGGEAKPAYLDGVKFRNVASSEEFEATLEAFAAPKEFGPCDGTQSIQNGLFATQQPRRSFSLSYRTKVGNAVEGSDHAYKIHLVYNALAAPAQRNNTTLSDSQGLNALSWSLTTLPPSLTGYKPTSHWVIDSRTTPAGLLAAVEDIIYGSESAAPRMPLVSELITLFQSTGPFVHRNLLLNPSWRTTAATLEIRRNVFRNPTCSVNATDWTNVNQGAGTTTGGRVAPDGSLVVNGQNLAYYRQTWDTVSTGAIASTGIIFGSPTVDVIPVTAGALYTISGYARSTHVGRTASLIVTTHDAGGGGQTVVLTTAATDISIGGFVRLSGSFVVPATHTRAYVRLYAVGGTPWAAGDAMSLGGVLVEAADIVFPYLDGDTPAADGLTYMWTSTAGASIPIAVGKYFLGISAPFVNYAGQSGMVGWQVSPGVYRLLCKRAVGSSGIFAFTSSTNVAAVSGKFYSGRVKIRQIGGNPDVPIPVSPALAAYTATPSIINVVAGSSSQEVLIPSDSDWIDWAMAASAAAGAGAVSLRWLIYADSGSAGAPAGTVLEFMEAMVEEVAAIGDLVAPYFDGSKLPDFGNTYSWDGPVDNSTSSMYSWN